LEYQKAPLAWSRCKE